MLQLVRYIHRNPLKAGLVKRLDQYVWSSHNGYLSKAEKWSWLYKNFVLEMLALQKSSQIRIYKQFMAQERDEDFAPDIDTIISEVSRYYDIRLSALKSVRRGIENEPRDVTMYLIRCMRSEPLMKIGADFGLNRYSSVSSAVVRVKNRLQKDRKFKDRLEQIESNILKSQTKA